MLKKRSPTLVIIGLIFSLLIMAITNVGLGAVPISPVRVIQSLVGAGDYNESYIIINYRMPRIVLALFVGGCLATAGVIAQSVLQNPLAAPDTLGVSGGASVSAVAISVLLPTMSVPFTGVAAFIGGAVAALAVYLIAYKDGIEPTRLALVGVSVSAFCSAGVELGLVKMNSNVQTSLLWLNGSLFSRTWEHVIHITPWAICLFIMVLFLSKPLDSLQLGDQIAIGLGVKVEKMKLVLLGASVLLTGASVAAAGMIGFVGLISPHIARQLVGSEHRYFIPVAALTGAFILLLADSLGRGLLPPIEIPAGLITSVIGAPYFIFLLWQQSRTRSE